MNVMRKWFIIVNVMFELSSMAVKVCVIQSVFDPSLSSSSTKIAQRGEETKNKQAKANFENITIMGNILNVGIFS